MPYRPRAELVSIFSAARYSFSASAKFPDRNATSPAAAWTTADDGNAARAFLAAPSASSSCLVLNRQRTNPACASASVGSFSTSALKAAAASVSFPFFISARAASNGSFTLGAVTLSAAAGAAGLTLSAVVCAVADAARHMASKRLDFMRHILHQKVWLVLPAFRLINHRSPDYPS